MAIIAFTNTKQHTVHIGGKAIAPGSTRPIEETLSPSYRPPAPVTPPTPEAEPDGSALTDQLTELLESNVNTVASALPQLSDDELDLLEKLESEADHPRKGVLEAILNLTVERANIALDEG